MSATIIATCNTLGISTLTVARFLEDGYNLTDAIDLAIEERKEIERYDH